MPGFSVKKPYTVLVAVMVIIVFGVAAFTKMVPDLFPNMDFPYIVVATTYPGSAPERVEEEVTKPLERSMATLNNIKSISSTSSENISVITLEFEQDTNIDSTTVDILQKIQTLTGRWNEKIGTPTIIRMLR